MKNRLIIALAMVFLPLLTYAQAEVEMADTLRAEGKIYIVVAVILVLFLGLFAYLFAADRRLKKLEEEFNQGK